MSHAGAAGSFHDGAADGGALGPDTAGASQEAGAGAPPHSEPGGLDALPGESHDGAGVDAAGTAGLLASHEGAGGGAEGDGAGAGEPHVGAGGAAAPDGPHEGALGATGGAVGAPPHVGAAGELGEVGEVGDVGAAAGGAPQVGAGPLGAGAGANAGGGGGGGAEAGGGGAGGGEPGAAGVPGPHPDEAPLAGGWSQLGDGAPTTVGATFGVWVATGGGAQVVTDWLGGPAEFGTGVDGRTGGPAFLRRTWRRRALR